MGRRDRHGGRAAQRLVQRGAQRPLLPGGLAPAQRDLVGELRFLQPGARLLDQAADRFVLGISTARAQSTTLRICTSSAAARAPDAAAV